MLIRPATEKDLPFILEIFNHEIIHTPYVYIYEPWSMDEISTWFRNKQVSGFPFLVAEMEGTVSGYAYFGKFREREAYDTTVEYSVYVHEEFRQQGIAFQLVSELMSIAKERNIRCMIGGVDAANLLSIQFHERMGFTQVAHIKKVARKFDEWRDLLFFQLLLE